MNLKELLKTKKGAGIELLLFFIVALSTLPVMLQAAILIAIAVISLVVRNTEWKEIGFDFKDFKIKKICLGIAVAVLYYFVDQYLIDPIVSTFATPGLPEIFSMKGNVSKLIIGLLISWTTAAFFEEEWRTKITFGRLNFNFTKLVQLNSCVMRNILCVLLFLPIFSIAQKPVPRFENDTLYTTSGFKIYKGQTLNFGKGSGWGGSFRFIRLIGVGSDNEIFTDHSLVVRKVFRYGVSPLGNYYIRIKGIIKFKDGSKGEFGFNMAFEKAIAYSNGPSSEFIVPEEFRNRSKEQGTVSEEISKLYKLYQDSIITKDEYELRKKKLLGD